MLTCRSTPLDDLLVVETQAFTDLRGAFYRCFCDQELQVILGNRVIRQVNHSLTTKTGSIRGLHFQRAPHQEMKLIRCIRGKVWDVAVDLRRKSPTFLKWHAVELSDSNRQMVAIPEGFAHGFQTLSPDCELLYLHTYPYTPASEGGVRFDDPSLQIAWPLPVSDVSQRDRSHLSLAENLEEE